MTIVEFFDPHNMDHLQAYNHLMDRGFWPKGFIAGDIEFPPGWQATIANKLANEWILHRLNEENEVYKYKED